MKILIDLCAADDDIDIIIADRKADGWDLKWRTTSEAATQVTANDRVGSLEGVVKTRMVLLFQKA